MTLSVILFSLGFLLGIYYNKLSLYLSKKNEKFRIVLNKNKAYNEVLEKLKNKNSKFLTRFNNTVFIRSNLHDFGDVELLYFIDRKDVHIFKDDKCIIDSKDVKNETLDEIIQNVNRRYHKKINDVVEVLGFVFYRKDFEKNFNINLEEVKQKADKMMKLMEEKSDVESIIQDNSTKMDIDEILDKINRVGIENLSKEELEFLNNYNK